MLDERGNVQLVWPQATGMVILQNQWTYFKLCRGVCENTVGSQRIHHAFYLLAHVHKTPLPNNNLLNKIASVLILDFPVDTLMCTRNFCCKFTSASNLFLIIFPTFHGYFLN